VLTVSEGVPPLSRALLGQSVAREVDGLGEHRLPQASVDGRNQHPLTEDLASRGEGVAVALLDELGDPLARQLDDQAAGLVVVGRQEPPASRTQG
jgi:hypothetical protein